MFCEIKVGDEVTDLLVFIKKYLFNQLFYFYLASYIHYEQEHCNLF